MTYLKKKLKAYEEKHYSRKVAKKPKHKKS